MGVLQTINFNTPNPVSAANLVFNSPADQIPHYRSDGNCWSIEGSGGFNFAVTMPNVTGMLLSLTFCGEMFNNQLIGIIDIVVNGNPVVTAYTLESGNWYTQSWFIRSSYFHQGSNTLSINLNPSTQLNGIWLQSVSATFEQMQKQTIDLSVASPVNTSNLSFPKQIKSNVIFNDSSNCWQGTAPDASIVINLIVPPPVRGVNLILSLCSSTVNGIANSPISISINGSTLVSNCIVTNTGFIPFGWYIQPSLLGSGLNIIQITLQSEQNVTPICINSATVVMFVMQKQLQTQWCWSAVATSTSIFYNSLSIWTQCLLANAALQQTTCCTNPGSSVCNISWYLDRALGITGNLVSVVGSAAAFNDIQDQTNQGLPLGARQGWSGGGGHFMILTGVNNLNNTQMVAVEDPWYGPSYIPYNTFVSGYHGTGKWTHTYYTKN